MDRKLRTVFGFDRPPNYWRHETAPEYVTGLVINNLPHGFDPVPAVEEFARLATQHYSELQDQILGQTNLHQQVLIAFGFPITRNFVSFFLEPALNKHLNMQDFRNGYTLSFSFNHDYYSGLNGSSPKDPPQGYEHS